MFDVKESQTYAEKIKVLLLLKLEVEYLGNVLVREAITTLIFYLYSTFHCTVFIYIFCFQLLFVSLYFRP